MDPNLRWPLAHNVIRRNQESNTFGRVRHNRSGTVRPHQGWDFQAAVGTPCFAISDGRIELVLSGGDYGNVIVLAFSFGGRTLYAAYAHLNEVAVTQGQAVTRGQQIGRTGDSGNARGMVGPDQHLHFEIRTVPRPGRGLDGRITPREVFGICPLAQAVEA